MRGKSKGSIRIGILGVSGKMGRKLESLITEDPHYSLEFKLVFMASGPQDPRFGLMLQDRPDVLIDFSAPVCSLEGAKVCGRYKIPMIVCTTGFSKSQMRTLVSRLNGTPWILAPNTSLGVYALKEALGRLSTVLDPNLFSIDIIEFHHRQKRDSPSGTALALEKKIRDSNSKFKISMHSIRGGTEVGEHQVHFLGSDERIVVTHRAQDRSLFAHGALRLAKKILSLRARKGPYSPDEVF